MNFFIHWYQNHIAYTRFNTLWIAYRQHKVNIKDKAINFLYTTYYFLKEELSKHYATNFDFTFSKKGVKKKIIIIIP